MIHDAAEIVFGLELVVARGDDDQVHAGSPDLLLNRRFGAPSERNHRQHRGDPDRHPKHRQGGLQAVSAQRLDGNRET
jgi:hypothetical protein